MDKIAIVASVKTTRIPGFDNRATQGADLIAYDLSSELSYAFDNIQLIQNYTTKARIINSLNQASRTLSPGGLCVFYFHGHGYSLPNRMDNDAEPRDQVLVCHDGFLFDDEIDFILQGFHQSHRILTIIDSCSSETVVEWKYEATRRYPQIIHIGACSDMEIANANTLGGLMSRHILNTIDSFGYSNYTYLSFCQRIKSLTNQKAVIRTTRNPNSFFSKKLFT